MVEVMQEDRGAAIEALNEAERQRSFGGNGTVLSNVCQIIARHRIAAEQRGRLEGGALFRKAIEDAIGYVQGQIGCSYCETSQEDWDFMHELEDLLGVPRTDKKSFYC